VRQALEDSPRLAQATAKLARAKEAYEGREGATELPQVDLNASVNRIAVETDRFKSKGLAQNLDDVFPLTLSLASVSVAYTFDVFGANRRELEGLAAEVDVQRFELEAVRLVLAGNVVTSAIQEASLREQIERTEAIAAVEERQLAILERLEGVGGAGRLDVEAQRGELARTRASLPPLRQRLEQNRHRMAVYLGKPPAAVTLPEFRLADLHLPTELPLSLPSDLVRQRPDIQAAEALLHVASARVGIATANFYPRITLSAAGGAVAISSLVSGVAGFGLLGASLAQPLFHGGELESQKRAAVAAFEQAGAAYREVVLTGFQDVADTLVALHEDAKLLRERAVAAKSARSSLDIAQKRYTAGGVSLRVLLNAERQQLIASLDETRAIRDRFADSAALFQALGGGWWTAGAESRVAAAVDEPGSGPTSR
jgi:NodT family efflux transporter outer membrane factor (OMF) lipoprotein